MRMCLFASAAWTLAFSAPATAIPNHLQESPTAVTAVNARDLERLSTSRDLASVVQKLACPSQTMPAFVRGSSAPPMPGMDSRTAEGSLACVQPSDLRMIDVLREHNRVRAAFGSQPLVWDVDLANGASAYAMQMPRVGLTHSPRNARPTDVRENVQHGLRGWSGLDLTRTWVGESRYFVPGTFPNVSSTGDWTNVAHFTQMVWPTTTRLGCGSYVSGRDEWFVCRYSGPGNRDGTDIRPMTYADNTSPVPRLDPRDLPKDKGGGGMQQIDPPPPPPPTARDDAPNGDESKHPLVSYGQEAATEFWDAFHNGDRAAQARALDKARYALDELRKRWKAAKKAGGFSAVDADKVKAQMDRLQRDVDAMDRRLNHPEERG